MKTTRMNSGVSVLLYCTAFLLIAATSVARAAPLPPPPDYLPDAGDSYFGHGDEVLSFELGDFLPSSFGFYFQGASGTLNPLFDSVDDPGDDNAASVNFSTGIVFDLDRVAGEYLFATSTANIGFYLDVGSAILYSDPVLNGGLDLFSAFQSDTDATRWLMIFEGIDATGALIPINASIGTPLTSVIPLPPTVWLMGSLLPILMFMSRRRKKSAAV